jgi:hypothetical protein
MALSGSIQGLHPAGATVQATLASGAAGITLNHYGAGTAIAYSFYPGQQFMESASQPDVGWLPVRWGQAQQQLAVEPAVLAQTAKPVVVSHDGVEADLLTSAQGDAIVLLNWTGQPLTQITVTLPNGAGFNQVQSAQGVALQTHANANGSLTVTLPLDNVDVLTLDRLPVTVSARGALQVGPLAAGSHTITLAQVASGVQLTLDGQVFLYTAGQITSITVNGGTNNDTINVQSLPLGVPATLNLGGSDTVDIGSAAHQLTELGSTIILHGSTMDKLLIDSQNDAGLNYTLTATAFGLPAKPNGPFAPLVSFTGVAQVTLNTGTGSTTTRDAVQVAGVAAGTAVTVQCGPNYAVVVGSSANTLSAVLGSVALHGQATDSLSINDQADPAATSWSLQTNAFVRSIAGHTGLPINISGFPAVLLNGGSGGNTFLVQALLGTPLLTLNGGARINTLHGPNLENLWQITGTNSGTLDGNIRFTAMTNLTGDGQDDTFQFVGVVRVTGSINGGGGTNTLNYSMYPAAFHVDLLHNKATGVGGLISGIQQVVPNNLVLTAPPPQNALLGQAFSYQVIAMDAARLPLTYSATGLPGGLKINATTGLISGTPAPSDPAKTYLVTVAVTDGLDSRVATLSLTLRAPQGSHRTTRKGEAGPLVDSGGVRLVEELADFFTQVAQHAGLGLTDVVDRHL